MLKRLLKVLILPLMVIALASPAWAGGINVIFDPDPPTPPGGPTEGNTPYLLYTDGPYTVTWETCTMPPLPNGSPLVGDAACLGFTNDTGASIEGLNISFTVSGPLVGLSLTCSNADSFLATNNCGDYAAPLTSGETVTLSFTGMNYVPPNYSIYIAVQNTGGGDINSFPDSNVTLPAYDPSTLMLVGTGMAFLALGALRRTA